MFSFTPRDMYSLPTDDGASNSSSSSSKTTPIIIGVVVGGVATIAITAGIIFFFIKKRKWDRIRQREERLIDYRAAVAIHNKSRSITPEDHYLNMMPPRPSSTFSTYPVTAMTTPATIPISNTHVRAQSHAHLYTPAHTAATTTPTITTTRSRATSVPEAPPPSYQALHPRYDPSQYRETTSTCSSASQTRNSRLSFIRPFPSQSRRSESLSAPLPPSLRPQSHMWSQQQQHPLSQAESFQGRPSGEWPLVNSASGSGSRSRGMSAPTTTTIHESADNEQQGPRKPKPILSKLITNF